MKRAGCWRVLLAKEDFKFSSAHFTVFDGERAELLHGHNYKVRVELEGERLDAEGLLIDLDRVKRAIRRRCAELDSYTIVPTASPHLAVTEGGGEVEVVYGERRYRLPAADVVLLPLANTTIELLAERFWEGLAEELAGTPIRTLTVEVAETAGQACAYRADLP